MSNQAGPSRPPRPGESWRTIPADIVERNLLRLFDWKPTGASLDFSRKEGASDGVLPLPLTSYPPRIRLRQILMDREEAEEAEANDVALHPPDAFFFPLRLTHLGQDRFCMKESDISRAEGDPVMPDRLLRVALIGQASNLEAVVASETILSHEFHGLYSDYCDLAQRAAFCQFQTTDDERQEDWVTASVATCSGCELDQYPFMAAVAPVPWMDFGADLAYAPEEPSESVHIRMLEPTQRLWLWFRFLAAVFIFVTDRLQERCSDTSPTQEQVSETVFRIISFFGDVDALRGQPFPSPGVVLLFQAEGFPETGQLGTAASRIRCSLPFIRERLHLDPYFGRSPFRRRARVDPFDSSKRYVSVSPLCSLVEQGRDCHAWEHNEESYKGLKFSELSHQHPLKPVTRLRASSEDPTRRHSHERDQRWTTAQLQPLKYDLALFPELARVEPLNTLFKAVSRGRALITFPPAFPDSWGSGFYFCGGAILANYTGTPELSRRFPEVLEVGAAHWFSSQMRNWVKPLEKFLPLHRALNWYGLQEAGIRFVVTGSKPHTLARVSATMHYLGGGFHSLLPGGTHWQPFKSLGLDKETSLICFGEAWVDASRGYFQEYCRQNVKTFPEMDFKPDERLLWSHGGQCADRPIDP